jgi:hypothetical protein
MDELPQPAIVSIPDPGPPVEASERKAIHWRAGKINVRTIGVLCGGGNREELHQAGCIAIYKDPADLLDHYGYASPISRWVCLLFDLTSLLSSNSENCCRISTIVRLLRLGFKIIFLSQKLQTIG